MHFFQRQQIWLLVWYICTTLTISVAIYNPSHVLRCNWLRGNCTSIRHGFPLGVDSHHQDGKLQTAIDSRSTLFPSTTTTTRKSYVDYDAFSDNLKRAALILAGIALGLGILRICLMLCKTSRHQNSTLANRHTAVVRPQIATIEQRHFKPDLPPAYAEAIANANVDGGKLPSYEELQSDQQNVRRNGESASTAL